MATDKISLDQAHKLLAAMGLPVADQGREGFRATARGGRTGTQAVKAARMVQVNYHLSRGARLTGRDIGDLPEVSERFQWAVAKASEYGYVAEWRPGSDRIYLTRVNQP